MNDQKSPGQQAYERDVSIEPTYHDGSARPAWNDLPAVARSSWERNPTDRQTSDGQSKVKFHVTFEVMTEESAEQGDVEERGTVGEFDKLKDALQAFRDDGGAYVDGVRSIETDSSPCERPRWVTCVWGQNFQDGSERSTSLHIPENVTAASARRIALLAGVDRRMLKFPEPSHVAEQLLDDDHEADRGVSR